MMLDAIDPAVIQQGSAEWHAARLGALGASRVADAIARTRSGAWGASRANLMAALVTERLTGTPAAEGYVSDAMRRGIELEAAARLAYEFRTDTVVEQVGFVRHPRIRWTLASPDGLVGDDGLVEIKCPNTATHLDALLGSPIAGRYEAQVAWQMACTGRAWCDVVSYDDRVPERMRLHIERVHRDDEFIRELEREVSAFLAEVDARVRALIGRFGD